jgi:hypothetical protein
VLTLCVYCSLVPLFDIFRISLGQFFSFFLFLKRTSVILTRWSRNNFYVDICDIGTGDKGICAISLIWADFHTAQSHRTTPSIPSLVPSHPTSLTEHQHPVSTASRLLSSLCRKFIPRMVHLHYIIYNVLRAHTGHSISRCTLSGTHWCGRYCILFPTVWFGRYWVQIRFSLLLRIKWSGLDAEPFKVFVLCKCLGISASSRAK